MPTLRTARLLAKGNGKTPQEMLERLKRINWNIDRFGYEKAFSRDNEYNEYLRYQYLKNNGRLRGENDDRS